MHLRRKFRENCRIGLVVKSTFDLASHSLFLPPLQMRYIDETASNPIRKNKRGESVKEEKRFECICLVCLMVTFTLQQRNKIKSIDKLD